MRKKPAAAKEALEQQAATAAILRTISQSRKGADPVFRAIARHAVRLCGAVLCNVLRYDGEMLHIAAHHGFRRSFLKNLHSRYPAKPEPHLLSGRVIRRRVPVHIVDAQADALYDKVHAARGGWRRMLGVPILGKDAVLGVLVVAWMNAGRTPKAQVELLKTFASQAVIAIENARLFNETKEGLERQTATAEILKVIASSPTDAQPVFNVIVESAVRLCGARFGRVYRYDGSAIHMVASYGLSARGLGRVQRVFPRPAARDTIVGQVILDRRPRFVQDIRRDKTVPPLSRQMIEALGTRSQVTIPMLRGGGPIGAITMGWDEPDGFKDKQVALLQTFADQAVIAIENVRLFNETKEALERQTATAEVLKVISSSPSDLRPVFDAILGKATALCEANLGILNLREGDMFRTVAQCGGKPDFAQWLFGRGLFKPQFLMMRMLVERKPVHVADLRESPGYRDRNPTAVKMVEVAGARTFLMIPLLKESNVIGVISVYRPEVRPFTEKQIALLGTFADQAVIAMENVRLFNETKEALERQTATSEVLKTISRSTFDLNAVLQVLIENATRLAGAKQGFIFRHDGQAARLAYSYNAPPAYRALIEAIPFTPGRGSLVGRTLLERRPVHIPDALADREFTLHEAQRAGGFRSMLGVPMIREGSLIGVIAMWTTEVRPFTQKQIELVSTFADQAVIAIENVRLFNETKEALEQQTASSGVLEVISRSPSDIGPVFDAILEGATRLCDAHLAFLNLYDGESYRTVAQRGANPEFLRWVAERGAFKPGPVTSLARVAEEREPVQILDMKESPAFRAGDVNVVKFVELAGARTYLVVPLLKEDRFLGVVAVYRPEVRAFTEKQIELVKTFARQAVIAMENVRLFNETNEALEQQTATAEILKVISGSPTDTQPVFQAIAERAGRICDATDARIFVVEGTQFRYVAGFGDVPSVEIGATRPIDRGLVMGRAVIDGRPVHVDDIQTAAHDFPLAMRQLGHRTALAVPLLRENKALGAILLRRLEVRPFSDKQIGLLKTFADQAAIAIENVRLFNETKEALEQQTATTEILKIISSSPTDVQPVFDGIVSSAIALFAPCNAGIWMLEGGQVHLRAAHWQEATGASNIEGARRLFPRSIEDSFAIGKSIVEQRIVEVPDTERAGFAAGALELSRTMVTRSCIFFPLMRMGEAIGCIGLSSPEVGLKLTDKQTTLMRTFADQAVIAIENVRLFNETKESLERQTATAEVLKVISGSPTDEMPVFDAIVASAARLFGRIARIRLVEDGRLILRARSDRSVADSAADEPLTIERDSAGGCVALDRVALQIPDTTAPDAPASALKWGEKGGYRAIAAAPLMRESTLLGVIAVTSPEPGGLTDKQMALLQTFADQAVIAIENVRLFNETKEGLEQQTAISEVLRVISSSPADVQPVLQAVAERAARICEADDARVFVLEGELLKVAAGLGPLVVALDATVPVEGSITGRVVAQRTPLLVDMASVPEGEFPFAQKMYREFGHRILLAMPLLREDQVLGVIVLRRTEGRMFTDKQSALLRTFADQAAIAIENVRLFNETKEALEQQTATAEVLNVISGSITDARPVFDAISRSVLRLYGARSVSLVVRVGERIDRVGYALADKSADDGSQALWPIPLDDRSLSGRAILGGELVHIRDVDTEPGLSEHSRAITQKTEVRSALVAPMFSMGAAIGALAVGRRAAGGFSEREVEMIRTFADQAVIAMENVRLFREIQEKSAQLEEASRHKSQFLASMSHELRTPLNALLGFNEMLLGDVYGEVPGDMRAPLAQMQSSGRHLLRLINNVLDLAKIEAGRMELALAEYSVHDTVESVRSTLQPLAADKGLDFRAAVPPEIPLAYGDHGRIAQCLMNLAGNSLKFTKAGSVEITVAMDNGLLRYRVADTGVGIPPEKIEGLFTEFKQTDATVASEYGGTGLGLSISKKFVEMHGGRIWAESEPGRGSVFTFEVPLRAKAA